MPNPPPLPQPLSRNPLQLWGTIRFFAVAYIVLLGVTTFMEEQGMSRSTPNQVPTSEGSSVSE